MPKKKADHITVSLYMPKPVWVRVMELSKSERRSLSNTVILLAEEALAARKQ